MKDCGSQLCRQNLRLEIMDYNFKILHRPGSQILSRIEPISLSDMLEINKKEEQCIVTNRVQAGGKLANPSNEDGTIEERNGTILHKRGFDIDFHIIPKENDTLFKGIL